MPADDIAATMGGIRVILPRKGTRARVGIIVDEPRTVASTRPSPTTEPADDSFWLHTNDVSLILHDADEGRTSSVNLVPRSAAYGSRLNIVYNSRSGGSPVVVSGDFFQSSDAAETKVSGRLANLQTEMRFKFGPRLFLADFEHPDRLPAEATERGIRLQLLDAIDDAIASYPAANGQRPGASDLLRGAHQRLAKLTDLQLALLTIEASFDQLQASEGWAPAVDAIVLLLIDDVGGDHACIWRAEPSGVQYLMFSRRMRPGINLYAFDPSGSCIGVVSVRTTTVQSDADMWAEAVSLFGLVK